jgi:hypothetical protein
MAHKLVNDAIFYIGRFLDSDERVSARFVSKQWNSSLQHIPCEVNHLMSFLCSISVYEWARGALGMPEAGREDMLTAGCLDLIIKWREELSESLEGFNWGENDTATLIQAGRPDVLQWAAENPPCPWDEDTCANAARNGNLHILNTASTEATLSLG